LQVCSQPYHWQDSEQQLLQQITNQLAIALQQARVYEALKAKLSEIGN
jgi:GAF domain-containing protein